jgi:hypothetical protein
VRKDSFLRMNLPPPQVAGVSKKIILFLAANGRALNPLRD